MNDRQIEFDKLFQVISTLRNPGGCPWDLKQTPVSLKKYLLEEAAELAEAIDKGDHGHICEELGDMFYILLLLILMHEEEDKFTCENVLAGITEKMIRRHPHVFSGIKTGSDSDLRQQWRQIKEMEKKGKK